MEVVVLELLAQSQLMMIGVFEASLAGFRGREFGSLELDETACTNIENPSLRNKNLCLYLFSTLIPCSFSCDQVGAVLVSFGLVKVIVLCHTLMFLLLIL